MNIATSNPDDVFTLISFVLIFFLINKIFFVFLNCENQIKKNTQFCLFIYHENIRQNFLIIFWINHRKYTISHDKKVNNAIAWLHIWIFIYLFFLNYTYIYKFQYVLKKILNKNIFYNFGIIKKFKKIRLVKVFADFLFWNFNNFLIHLYAKFPKKKKIAFICLTITFLKVMKLFQYNWSDFTEQLD